MPLVEHPNGNYRFLPGIAPYSCGVVASPGFEIVHVTLSTPVPYRDGFERIARFLDEHDRPPAALCAMALRSPEPFSFAGFSDFNLEYAALLRSWRVFVDGVNPVARTNVAPVVQPPGVPALYSFAFTRPGSHARRSTFMVAGAGELPEGVLARDDIVALGDTSAAGLETKARFVMDLMESRLRGLEVAWDHVSTVNVYTAHSVTPLLPQVLLGRMNLPALQGVTWHYTRPPVQEIEFEMDVRGVDREYRIDP